MKAGFPLVYSTFLYAKRSHALAITPISSHHFRRIILCVLVCESHLLFKFSRNQARFSFWIHQSIHTSVDVGEFLTWGIMATREDRILALEATIAKRERERDELPVDDLASRLTLSEEITIKEKRLFSLEQQGKFSSPISVVLSHSYR